MTRVKNKKKSFMHGRPAAAQLIRILEGVCTISGLRPHQVFEDWVRLCEAALTELPRHVAMLQAESRMLQGHEDSEATQALWRELERRYHQRWNECYAIFAETFQALLEATQDGISDILGSMFHEWELSNHWKGQFFTPFEVGRMMAEMNDPTVLIHERLKAALAHPENELGQALLLAGAALDGAEAERFFVEQLIPAALPYYEPVTVCDPAVGSGCLLLAVASIIPWWATTYGLAQFYGQDIDQLCVAMCRMQCMVFGLNGYPARLLISAASIGDLVHNNEQCEGLPVDEPIEENGSLAPELVLVEAEAPLSLVEG